MPRERITIVRKGFNFYEIRVGGKPVAVANGKLTAMRIANGLRKQRGQKVR